MGLNDVLLSLLIAAIGALGVLVKLIKNELESNTQLTKQTKTAANSNVAQLVAQLATERNRVQGLLGVVHEREDRIAYLLARHPNIEASLQAYQDRRSRKIQAHDADLTEQKLLQGFFEDRKH